jgi:tetratricopeptide (TPR) repeat protein
VLVRAGRPADAFRLIERIALPRTLPANASPSMLLFYIDIAETRMTLLATLERYAEATAAAKVFRATALPAADALLADSERNVIMAGTVAATLNQAALTLVHLGLNEEAAAVADKAATLIAKDRSPGVRLVGARIELVAGFAQFNGGEAAKALPRFDRAYSSAQAIVPAESDEMYEIVAGRGMARLALGQAAAALADLRSASDIARARIGRENRFNDQGTQKTVRPTFTSLVGAAWRAAQ